MSVSSALPPLHRLVAFEAAARLGSFTAAAQELGSTQSAVSQHIKHLEADLGSTLFHRMHRGVVLTRTGSRVYQWTEEGLKTLSTGYREAKKPGRHESITLSTDYALGTYWLLPRLRNFRQRHPDLDVRLVTAQHSVSPDEGDVDIGLAFGDGHRMHEPTQLLFPEAVVPVCSPGLLAQYPDMGHWKDLPLLELEDEEGNHWFDWPDLFAALGLQEASKEPELIFNNYTLLLQAALSGQGVAIGWSPFVEPLLETGALVALTDTAMRSNQGYQIVFPSNRELEPIVLEFIDWLIEEGRQTREERALQSN
ncbi:LysR family transcriptional regulator [Natronospirillum operosum]|uniref:LysR family transcriptional regulator n=1 Tax=Natronospirillum operosum TaxID=2759953 RepID=A0A4Z0WFS1_9GAMM|nr:LysR substrate-binding domain-containing protein [Natronospirillum operosum]TGG95458.1 LysR family transcriptional regulator [Natronospirillum operosum]